MHALLTWYFWERAIERAIKTFAQSLIAVLGVGSLGILSVPWLDALSVAALATVVSILTSIASIPVGDDRSPSLISLAPPPVPPPPPPAPQPQ